MKFIKKLAVAVAPMIMSLSVFAAGLPSIPKLHEPKVPSRLIKE